MAGPSRRLLVTPFVLACIGCALFAATPQLIRWLNLAPDEAAAVLLHHASGIWMFLALAWLVSRFGEALLRRVALVSAGAAASPRLLLDLLRAILFVVAGLMILRFVFDQSPTGLLTLSSVLIAVIGFALRNVISDLVSGIAVGVEQPYRIGDWIETAQGSAGKVTEITWRTTRLIDRNGFVIILPNGLIAGQRLINYSGGERDYRTALRVPLDAQVPAQRAKRILLSGALDADRRLAGLKPDVLLAEYSAGSAIYLVRFRVPDFAGEAGCRDVVASRVLHAIHCAGLSIARGDTMLPETAAPPLPPQETLLCHADLFRGFDSAERSALAAKMRRHDVAAGQIVVRQGDPGDCLFLLAEGILNVVIERQDAAPLRDRIAPGEVFGEMSLLTGQPRGATVTAGLDAVVYEIRREDLDPILRQRPEIAEGLAGVMAEHQAHNDRYDDQPEQAAGATRADLLARLRLLFHL
jgi:small-conductance mechanosensitive channel/CRP-like cAMP-binding protein